MERTNAKCMCWTIVWLTWPVSFSTRTFATELLRQAAQR